MPAAGPRALAIAVYSDATGESFGARESGVEGVACVDDAARAVTLLAGLWTRTQSEALRSWAEGLLDFVLWMHDGAGLWVNFIYDWTGTKNLQGPTSVPGPNFWQARAVEAATTAASVLNRSDALAAASSGFAAAAEFSAPSNVRAIHSIAALERLRVAPDPWLQGLLNSWCDQIAEYCSGGILMNSPDERGRPHLWGHIQEAVLAEAGRTLRRPELVELARRSAAGVFGEAINSSFDLPNVQPYGVQSAVFVMDRLGAETRDPSYAEAAANARAWFGGRNPAHLPVYDRDEGRVADGIDEGVINRDSGAEANISAGLALMDDSFVLEHARRMVAPGTEPLK